MNALQRGFTLIEVMIVVSVIAVLSGILYINFNAGSAQSRDAERRSDLRNLQNAIELYKSRNGQYPAGCNGPTTTVNPVWSGQTGTSYACLSGNQYIVGLAPEFIRVLPVDPKLNGLNSGYVYTTNAARSVYKIMALNTVESQDVPVTDEFARCGVLNPDSISSPSWDDDNICARTPNNPTSVTSATGGLTGKCTLSSTSFYNRSYALSGGFSTGFVDPAVTGGIRTTDRAKEYDTEIVRCN